MTEPSDLYAPHLQAIAAALGVPPGAFFASSPPADESGGVIELLRLWATIGDTQGQRRVLTAARREAERAAAAESPGTPNVVLFRPGPY